MPPKKARGGSVVNTRATRSKRGAAAASPSATARVETTHHEVVTTKKKGAGNKATVASNAASIGSIFEKLDDITDLIIQAKSTFVSNNISNMSKKDVSQGQQDVTAAHGPVNNNVNPQINATSLTQPIATTHTISNGSSVQPPVTQPQLVDLTSVNNVPYVDVLHRGRHTSSKGRGRTAASNPYLDYLEDQQTSDSDGLPNNVSDLEDSEELQERVTRLLMGNLSTAPRNTRGKQWYACNFIFRGEKKEKVGLAELSIAEYNVGFSKLIAQKHFKPEDRIRMVKHINQVNEDATTYDWGSVRTWSEGICKAIADKDLKWKDQYAIDRERQRVSQRGSATGGSAGASGGKTCHSLTAELRAANRAPPCRQYNQGSMSIQRGSRAQWFQAFTCVCHLYI